MSRPIILPDDQIARIVDGRATELRRLLQTSRETRRPKAPALKTGLTYEIQADSDTEIAGRITITSVAPQQLADLTATDARAEGFTDKFDRGRTSDDTRILAAYADQWMTRRDRTWPPSETTETLCPKCEGHTTVNGVRCDGGCDDVGTIQTPVVPTGEQTLARFHERHGSKWVWVIRFEPCQHLWLHRQSQRGYTSNPADALLEAGTVLDPPSAKWAKNAEEHRLATLRSETGVRLAGLATPEERLGELRQLFAEHGLDDSTDLQVVGDRLGRIEEKVRRAERRAA